MNTEKNTPEATPAPILAVWQDEPLNQLNHSTEELIAAIDWISPAMSAIDDDGDDKSEQEWHGLNDAFQAISSEIDYRNEEA